MGLKKKKPFKSLAAGRPPIIQRPKSMSRKSTRQLINNHHLLEKEKSKALALGDHAAVARLNSKISALGGIEKYQQASLQGQRNDRGGDTSRVLMEWLQSDGSEMADTNDRLQMLEVGALSISNDCAKSGMFDLQRIDLNSQSEGILQQDFMKRPLPKDESERFDIISLSLVLNFVPDPTGRGHMLLRTLEFLKEPQQDCQKPQTRQSFPSLFLVLPAPCVDNSRYMTAEKLEAIMKSMGYTKTKSKSTNKLVYFLWVRTSAPLHGRPEFKKTELRSGKSRNNFAIVLQGSHG